MNTNLEIKKKKKKKNPDLALIQMAGTTTKMVLAFSL